MREIKFRGYGKDVTGEHWIYGNLLDEKLIGLVAIQDEKCHVWEVDPESVGQFTGLRDSDRREIYEGDIVKIKDLIEDTPFGVVTMHNDSARFIVLDSRRGCLVAPLTVANSFIIIGNVHDNPELLEKQP